MNIIILTWYLVWAVGVPYAQQTERLQLDISNIRSTEGRLMIAVYDSERTFMTRSVCQGAKLQIDSAGSMITELDLPFGYYAISIFHDKNNNGKLDRTLFGIPVEDYGFSNNPRLFMGPPSFEQARFRFRTEGQQIAINLH